MLVFAYKQSEGEMKKAIVFVLIAIVAVSSAFAFKFNSVGIETGNGLHVSLDMEVADNFDVYARLGYTGLFDISSGAQYKVGEFKLGKTAVAVKPGAQINFDFRSSDGANSFIFEMFGTCSFQFDAGSLTAFLRPGIGFMASTYTYGDYKSKDNSFAWLIETGVAYLFN